jgi:hypothetical protein
LDGAQGKKCAEPTRDLRKKQADKEFEILVHVLNRFQQGTKCDGLILVALLRFCPQGWCMDSFVLQHAFHRLGKVLNAIIDGAILGMMNQSVKNMVVEDSCSQHLGDMGSFHPRDKVFFDGRAKIKGNIVKDHQSRKGFYLLL